MHLAKPYQIEWRIYMIMLGCAEHIGMGLVVGVVLGVVLGLALIYKFVCNK